MNKLMKYNVPEEVIYLENIISKALDLLNKNKIEEVKELLEKEDERINKSYE